jgi:hypothetical protein
MRILPNRRLNKIRQAASFMKKQNPYVAPPNYPMKTLFTKTLLTPFAVIKKPLGDCQTAG